MGNVVSLGKNHWRIDGIAWGKFSGEYIRPGRNFPLKNSRLSEGNFSWRGEGWLSRNYLKTIRNSIFKSKYFQLK